MAVLGAALVGAVHAQTVVLFEDFEDSTVEYITSVAETSDGNYDYFGRIASDGISVGGTVAFSNVQGGGFFGGQDLDASNTAAGDPNAPGAQATVSWTGLDVSGLTGVSFSALFAEDDYGDAENWDYSDDYVLVEYRMDGGSWQSLLRFENDGTTYNSAPYEDTDFDGVGDGVELTSTFALFSRAIPVTGASLDLRITIDLNSGDEDIAFDNVSVTGTDSRFVEDVTGQEAFPGGEGIIYIGWNLNAASNDVVLVRSDSGFFGTPESGVTYTVGSVIPGGGSVVYAGGASGFEDSGLTVDREYVYGIWSVDASANYSSGVSCSAPASAYSEGLCILHVNDVHSRLTPHDYDITGIDDVPVLEKVGGAAYLTTKMLELKEAHPGLLILDAGDVSEGSVLGDIGYNRGFIDFYNMLDAKLKAQGGRGIDAAVVGNHDVRHISMISNMLYRAEFPFISMNIVYNGTTDRVFPPYVTVMADGKKVGILGYTTDTSSHLEETTEAVLDVLTCSWNDSGTDIQIKDYVNELRDQQNCDAVVLLMHVGHSRAASDSSGAPQLVEDDGETDPPDVAIAGHWHTMTETAWQPSDINHKLTISEAASYMQYIGELNLTDHGDYVDASKHVVRCADIAPDPDVKAYIETLKDEYNAHPNTHCNDTNITYAIDQVIGYSADELRLNKNKWFTHAEYPWAGDNNAGAWVADSMQWYVNSLPGHQCDIALQSGGGVRRDNDAGEITYLELYETYPWVDDTMIIMHVAGQKIWDFIEEDHCGTSISQGWEVFADDGIISNITHNGVDLDPSSNYWVCVSKYMYAHDNDFSSGGWDGASETELDYSIRQTMIDYTSQFTESNPMTVPGPRYHLNTGSSGRFRAVVTMVDDENSEPYFESAYIRLLRATADTVERRGGYVDEALVLEDGSICATNQLAEVMLYRSYLGFEAGSLTNGMIIDVQGEFGFFAGNPQFTDQNGIVSDGVEFRIAGVDPSLARPAFMGSIDEFWDEWHENHYIVFEAEKTGATSVTDRKGNSISVYKEGGYNSKMLPGSEGDMLRLTGVQTYRNTERRFRCADVEVIGAVDYTPVSSVDAVAPSIQSGGLLTLTASATDSVVQTRAQLSPVADAHVTDGDPDRNSGSSTTLYLQSAATTASSYGDERIWTRFDLSGLPAGVSIESATLQIYCWRTDYASSDMVADLYSCTDDAWAESGITWNSQPAGASLLDSVTLSASGEYVWYDWDVTSFAAAENTGDGLLSLMLKPHDEDAATENSFSFDAKEYSNGSLGPFLQIEFSGAAAIGGTVTELEFFYRYSADGNGWSDWTSAGSCTDAPWEIDFDFANGEGMYEFYTVATDNSGNVEPAPLLADARVYWGTDSDGDGLDDHWEQQFFGGLAQANGESDCDHDGFMDIDEYRAGTSPTNAADLLVMQAVPGREAGDGQIVIRWVSVSNKTYSLQSAGSLSSGFTNMVSGILATPPENIVTGTVHGTEGFFRVQVDE